VSGNVESSTTNRLEACDTTLYDFRVLLFAMRLLAYVNHLYKDYCFPYYPPAFGWYWFNAGYLSEPLFELQTTLQLLHLINSAELISTCGVRSLSLESYDFGYYIWQWTTHY